MGVHQGGLWVREGLCYKYLVSLQPSWSQFLGFSLLQKGGGKHGESL